jgi:hypothetical protein
MKARRGKKGKPQQQAPEPAESAADHARRERERDDSEPKSTFESGGDAPLGIVGIFRDRGRTRSR